MLCSEMQLLAPESFFGGFMLNFARRQSPIVIHIVFWPIIAVFVIWGFERYGSPIGGAAAVVNDHTITALQYRNTLQQMIETYSKYMGGNFDENMQKQFRIKEAAINQLVGMELVTEQAEKMGLQVTDAEVRDQITNNPYLQKEGRFSKEYYDGVLQYRHMTASQFEDEIRKDILRSKADHLFETQIRPSNLELEKEKVLRSIKMNVAFMNMDRSDLANKMTISDSVSDEYFKDAAHEAEVKKYYELHRSEFSKPEEVKASHILVKANKEKDAEVKAAQSKIAKIQQDLKTKSFEEVARQYSDDPGSKSKGGDLGWFAKDSKVSEFAEAAFTQEPGKVGPPIQTVFGFHLIKVAAKHPAITQTYDDVKRTIAKKLIAQDRIEKTFLDAEKKLATAPQEALKELQGLDKSLKWEETGFFTAADEAIPKIGENEELAAAAMSLSEKENVFPHLVRNGNSVYVLKLVKEEKATAPAPEKAANQSEKEYGRTIFGAWAGSLRNTAKVTINNPLISGQEQPDSSDNN